MEDCALIDEEQHRQKQNNVCLQRQEEDQRLIADGEGKISQATNKILTTHL
jgi:hypothetical protein